MNMEKRINTNYQCVFYKDFKNANYEQIKLAILISLKHLNSEISFDSYTYFKDNINLIINRMIKRKKIFKYKDKHIAGALLAL